LPGRIDAAVNTLPACHSAIRNRQSAIVTADRVLTLVDLEAWSRPGVSLAVLGHPIQHSLSPAMHNAALAQLAAEDKRFADWRYYRFDVPPDALPRALELLHAKQFFGVNLTVPHKVIAFDRVTDIDSAAQPVGAINTLRRSEGGWRGFNTDGYGLATGIRETLRRELAGSHVVLIGAGGAARGAAVECLQRKCASLWVVNRTRANLQSLFEALSPLAHGVPFHGFAPSTPPHDLPAGAIVINATSAGLHDSDPPPIDLAILPRPAAVYDMIYNPAETRLLRQAAFLGIPHANGLSMLVHQGAKALEIWTDVPANRTAMVMAQAAEAGLAAQA
jgi:shikimate dehydrogenase